MAHCCAAFVCSWSGRGSSGARNRRVEVSESADGAKGNAELSDAVKSEPRPGALGVSEVGTCGRRYPEPRRALGADKCALAH